MHRLELLIQDVAFGGKGVGRAHGKALFVPFTIDGEHVIARITRDKKQFAEAELVEVAQASPQRTTPKCPYFGRCGGCSYQHIEYKHQLALKERQVEQLLRRIGRFPSPPMQPIIPSPKSYNYRNRVTVHAESGVIGYYRRDVHQLIDVEVCPIAVPEVNEKLSGLRARHPRDGHYTLRAHPPPRTFAQANDGVAELLAQLVESFFPAGQRLLIDAYCGAGFFAKRLLKKFERVIGIEWDRFAIAAAQNTATPKEHYIVGDVDLELARELASADLSNTSVVVDPPATGLNPNARQALLKHIVQTFVYVSCNPATLARDLKELQQHYRIVSVTPLDMFPQTAEIECAVQLERATAPHTIEQTTLG
ncbi:MAG: class I SAM-dependent RNA methyltransferase [Chthoniobacterales bacterium]|nr:class I SAM-dependent RNA methyltransferase [Chthoniobacterales bacterium]